MKDSPLAKNTPWMGDDVLVVTLRLKFDGLSEEDSDKAMETLVQALVELQRLNALVTREGVSS